MINRTGFSLKPIQGTQTNSPIVGAMNSGNSISSNTYKSPTSLSKSFEKMGLGGIGSLGGRMSELEKASLRLAQFRGIKTKEEQDRESATKMKLQASENQAKMKMQERQIQADREAAERAGRSI
jgi:hypothetical protein